MRRSFPLPSADLVLIRKAIPSDLPFIREIEQQAGTAAHWAEGEYEALFSPEAPLRTTLVAAGEADTQQLYGFLIARCVSEEWEIENVAVSSEWRWRGVASAMVAEVLRSARQGGATSVLLEVRESNDPARRLYERLGFSEVGRRKGYYGNPPEDALLLRISVTAL